jgi:hypothetical protein
MSEQPMPDASEMSTQPTSTATHAPAAETHLAAALDPAVFQYLLGRIEQLSRELGRAEGKQLAFERQVARLEQQLARLERGE